MWQFLWFGSSALFAVGVIGAIAQHDWRWLLLTVLGCWPLVSMIWTALAFWHPR
jgi:hypothetical protein